MLNKIKIIKALKKDREKYNKLKTEIFKESYYATINFEIKDGTISEKDYFIVCDEKKVGVLNICNSVEFGGKFGIGLLGILKEYRKQGLTKYAINFCKRLAKRRKETILLATIPKESEELQTIFRKIGFKGGRNKTHVYFEDCMFGMLKDVQLKYIDLSKASKTLKWQELVMEL